MSVLWPSFGKGSACSITLRSSKASSTRVSRLNQFQQALRNHLHRNCFRNGKFSIESNLWRNQSSNWEILWHFVYCYGQSSATSNHLAKIHRLLCHLFSHRFGQWGVSIANSIVVSFRKISIKPFSTELSHHLLFGIKGRHSTGIIQSDTQWLSPFNSY